MTSSAAVNREGAYPVRPYVDFYRQEEISPVAQDISDLDRHFQRRQALYRHLGISPGLENRSSNSARDPATTPCIRHRLIRSGTFWWTAIRWRWNAPTHYWINTKSATYRTNSSNPRSKISTPTNASTWCCAKGFCPGKLIPSDCCAKSLRSPNLAGWW